jgi:N-acetylmuramoyl-L-alanine amidase
MDQSQRGPTACHWKLAPLPDPQRSFHNSSVRFTTLNNRTKVRFPRQVPIPITVTLTLHNTIAQTDTILQNRDAIIERLDWQQITPTQIQYQFRLRSDQQCGYKQTFQKRT